MDRRNIKIRRNKKSLYLPQEIIEDILLRLSVKSLLRLKYVSKSWLSLISSKYFMIKHLKNSTMSAAHRRVIFNMRSYLDGEPIDLSSHDDSTKVHPITGRIIGCCNGMLCIYKRNEGRLILWNPTTRTSAEIPNFNHMIRKYGLRKCGFGWDEESGAYKVFVNVSVGGVVLGQVYSSKTNSWKTVNPGSCDVNRDNGAAAFACGKIHWIVWCRQHKYVESFDLKSEVFERMKLPCSGARPFHHQQLRERGGRLWVVRDYWRSNEQGEVRDYYSDYRSFHREMWVMEQYGVEESWVKVANLWQAKIVSGDYDVYFYTQSLVSPNNL